jgi:hypothetical protein
MKLFSVMALTLAFALPGASIAQWQWIDKDGRKVYSDRSPPSDIPANKILKQPGGASVAARAAAAPEAAPAPAPAASALKVSGKEKELEYKI